MSYAKADGRKRKWKTVFHICRNNANISEKNDWIISSDIESVIAIHIFSLLAQLSISLFLNFYISVPFVLLPFLFTILSLYLFLNEAFKAKGNDYNLLFTPHNGSGDCFFLSFSLFWMSVPFFPHVVVSVCREHVAKWLAVNQWSNLFTQCFSQSKQIFVHCAHEILNWLWYKKGNPMRIKIATWYRGTAHHEQWYVLVSVCDQNLFHSAKLNRGNYRCEHSMSHLRCPSAFNEIRCLGKSNIAICVDPCGYFIRDGTFSKKKQQQPKNVRIDYEIYISCIPRIFQLLLDI